MDLISFLYVCICPVLPAPFVEALLFIIVLKLITRAVRKETELKVIRIGNEEIKLYMFMEDMIFYLENPTHSTKNC